MSRCWQFLLGAWAMACSLARDVRPHLVGMPAIPQTTTAPGARANDGLRRRAGTLPGSQQQAQSRSPAWLEFQPVARLDGRPQTPDLVPPSRDEAVELGVLAVGPHTALAERELMLRIYQRRRCSSSYPVDAARPKHAIADDLLILARGHRMADFLRQLLADHSPFPHAASPHRERHKYEERQEDGEPHQRVADECIEKPDVGRGLVPGRRLAFGDTGEREKERQCVVQHVCRDGKDEPDDRREDPDPPAPGLDGETKGCAENSGEHRVPTEP